MGVHYYLKYDELIYKFALSKFKTYNEQLSNFFHA